MNKFSANLREKRANAGFPTTKSFAEYINIPYSTYAPYEKGAYPKGDVLMKIAQALHCTTDELLGYSLDNDEYARVKAELISLGCTVHEGDNNSVSVEIPIENGTKIFDTDRQEIVNIYEVAISLSNKKLSIMKARALRFVVARQLFARAMEQSGCTIDPEVAVDIYLNSLDLLDFPENPTIDIKKWKKLRDSGKTLPIYHSPDYPDVDDIGKSAYDTLNDAIDTIT